MKGGAHLPLRIGGSLGSLCFSSGKPEEDLVLGHGKGEQVDEETLSDY